MKVELSQESIEKIANRVALLIKGEDVPEGEYITTSEAARILGISSDRLRHLKDKFPHVKSGINGQGKLLFLKSALLGKYING